ncbi:MAG TPA: hypothetical protein VK063_09970 [Beutenbergiaceae bacterium]|nr:hypothetical protein [Beutenbergiaceae bacterium]
MSTVRPTAPRGRRSRRALVTASLGTALALVFSPVAASHAEVPAEDSRVARILAQDQRLEYLGTPVTSQIPSQAAPGFEDGHHVSYQVFKGEADTDHPATFVVTDVETGEQLSTCSVDGAEHVRNLNVASDGVVYWGTYYDSHLWSYDPSVGECQDHGPIDEDWDRSDPFGISPGPDGTVYLGSYPDARLYMFDPAGDGQPELLHELDPNAEYIHSIAYYEPDDAVYVGTGGQEPRLWRIADAGRGEPTLIADKETVPGLETAGQWIARMDIVEDRIIGQVGLRMLVLDMDGRVVRWDPDQERTHFGHHTIPGPEQGTAIFSADAGQLMLYDLEQDTIQDTGINIGGYLSHGVVDDSSGTPLLYGTSASGVFVADLEAGSLVSQQPIDFAQPTHIQKLFSGPDDTVWASGYMIGLAQVDKSGEAHGGTMNLGQFESAVARDGKLYLGAYGHARFDVMDPQTFDPEVRETVQTLFNGEDEGQDRPNGIAYNPDRDEIYLGAVAAYGSTQGGLAIWEGATGEHTWLTSEIGEDENVVSVAYNPTDGRVYLGTTIHGGLASDPSGNTAGKLIVFDPDTRSVVEAIDPAGEERRGITGLMVDDDGAVWGVAEEILFRFDPDTGETENRGTVGGRYADGVARWSHGSTHESSRDGRIYVTAGGRFSVHDPQSGETSQIGTGFGWSVADGEGDIYVSAGGDLFRYNVPEPDDVAPDPIEVAPEPVLFIDEPGSENDAFTIPEAEGVQYLLDGEVIQPGTYPGVGSVTVAAAALEGYALAQDAPAEWSHTFDSEPAETPGAPGETSDQEGSGQDGADDPAQAGSGAEGELPGTGAGVSGLVLGALAMLVLGVIARFVATRARSTS